MNKQDRELFLRMKAKELYEESHRVSDSFVFKPKFKLSRFIDNHFRAVIVCGGPTLFFIMASIMDM